MTKSAVIIGGGLGGLFTGAILAKEGVKVSVIEKSRQFVLLSGEDIVWVVGRRIDDRYRITKQTENILKITKQTL